MRLPPFLFLLFVLLGLAQPTFAGSWVVSYQTQGGSDLNPSSSSSLAWPATISSPSVSQGQGGAAFPGSPGVARSTGTVTAKFTWTSYYAGDTSPPPNTESLGVKVTVAANANATASQGSFTLTVRDGYGDPRTSPTATSAQSSGVHYEAVPVSQGTDGKWTATVPSCTLFAEAQLQGTRSYGGDYAGASVTYTAEPTDVGARILRWNGSAYVPITDANRKVLPGQLMDLTVQVTGGTVQQNQWQIPPYPTAFRKYYPLGIANQLEELESSDLTHTNVAFYWTKGGMDRVVSNSVTISLTTGEVQTYKVQDTLTTVRTNSFSQQLCRA